MAEEQAFDRVHRMGQTRAVTVIRYIMKDSIEEHVVLVQRNKSKIIAHSVASGNDSGDSSLKASLMKVRDSES
ncbi:MAG: DNA helicase rad5 [Heterodermia speciosa]|uniref:DNA helicase rad5 n=1 Tax=Heterodermia speciosa TaxID=116794 RepID=A0A8H3G4U2_9LECA|nr:MAG: DNA helicase rad5 [Heterodermia speciosa]